MAIKKEATTLEGRDWGRGGRNSGGVVGETGAALANGLVGVVGPTMRISKSVLSQWGEGK